MFPIPILGTIKCISPFSVSTPDGFSSPPQTPISLFKKPLYSVSVPTPITRTMATSAPRKFEWLVVVPDKPNMLAKRLEVRPYVIPESPDSMKMLFAQSSTAAHE